jgi:general secretion pathway protein J
MSAGRHCRHRGFTLIELLVALFIMALLSVMSWRGIDGMARSQEISRARADEVASLQTTLAQWQTDLDQMLVTPQTNAIDFDGRVLRITRRYGQDELRVVGWTQRVIDGKTHWLRWQSDALGTRAQLLGAWAQVAQWSLNPGDAERRHELVLAAIDEWQVFYYRNDAWTNPLSTAAGLAGAPTPPTGPTSPVQPDGVRLVVKLSPGQALEGALTYDWIRPIIGGGKT